MAKTIYNQDGTKTRVESHDYWKWLSGQVNAVPIDRVDPINIGGVVFDPRTWDQPGNIAAPLLDPTTQAQRRKFLLGYNQIDANRQANNAKRATTLMSGAGTNLLDEARQGGLISQPLLTRKSLG